MNRVTTNKGNIITNGELKYIVDEITKATYSICNRSLLCLSDYETNTDKKVKNVSYCIHNNEAIILNLIEY